MSEARADSSIKQAMATYELLILAQGKAYRHRQQCEIQTDCLECAATNASWKEAKQQYLESIRKMIG